MKNKLLFLIRSSFKFFLFSFYSVAIQLNMIFSRSFDRSAILVPQNGTVGGTMSFTLGLTKYLNERNYKLSLLVPSDELENYKSIFGKYNVRLYSYMNELDHIEHYYSRKHSLYKYFWEKILDRQIFILRHALRNSAGTIIASVVHPGRFSSFFLFPGKVRYFIHTIPWVDLDPGNLNIIKKSLGDSRKNILTVSEYAKDKIVEHWKLEQETSKIKVIYNYYEPVSFRTESLKPNIISILTLGNLIKDKNPKIWYEAAKMIIHNYGDEIIRFVWAGNGELLEYYQEIAKNENSIHFIGWVSDVDSLYAESDIYIQPSYAESHGIAVVGAMAHGLPCIVTNIGGTTESIQHDINGYLCDSKNKDELVFYIEKLINNAELRRRLGNEGKRIFSKKFTRQIWEANMSQIL